MSHLVVTTALGSELNLLEPSTQATGATGQTSLLVTHQLRVVRISPSTAFSTFKYILNLVLNAVQNSFHAGVFLMLSIPVLMLAAAIVVIGLLPKYLR